MILDVKYIVNTCDRCQKFKPQPQNSLVETIPTKPSGPFTKVGLDIIGPLPQSNKGHQYIIVLVDYLTKWIEADPLVTTESKCNEVYTYVKGTWYNLISLARIL